MGGQLTEETDPLTNYFHACGQRQFWILVACHPVLIDYIGLLGSKMYLQSEVYNPCFLSEDLMRSKSNQRPRDVFCYRAAKQLWSITPNFPDNSLHGLPFKYVSLCHLACVSILIFTL